MNGPDRTSSEVYVYIGSKHPFQSYLKISLAGEAPNFILANKGKHLPESFFLASPKFDGNSTVRTNFSKCNNARGTQQILHMEQSSRSQILEVLRMYTHSNSPRTNRNCLWIGSRFTKDNHTTRDLQVQSSRGRPIPDSVCRSTSSTEFPDDPLHIRLQVRSR